MDESENPWIIFNPNIFFSNNNFLKIMFLLQYLHMTIKLGDMERCKVFMVDKQWLR